MLCQKEHRIKVDNAQTLSQQEFFDRCKNFAHSNIDYSNAVYRGQKVKVKLSCIEHHEVFYMKPDYIYRGSTGCAHCLGKVTNQEQFLQRCKATACPTIDYNNAIYLGAFDKVKLSCKEHPEKVFYMVPGSIYKGYNGCPSCANSGISQKEQDLADFIKSVYNSKIVLNDRTILNGKELDIYLPDKQLAIEFNGVYWHSSAIKSPKYHYKKYKECQSKGIRLIQIWEDTWDSRKETVKHFLRQELSTLPVENIKDTTITTNLDTKTVKNFLNSYHLEGYTKYNYAIGLKHQSTKELLSVMTFTKTANKGELLLSRFATKTAISGGFNALIDTAKESCVKGLYRAKNSSTVTHFIAYTNNETDTGELYKNNGWQSITALPISYTYWHRTFSKRVLKIKYNKHKFKTSRKLQYRKGLTLKQLEELNSLYRCYDTGKVKWRLMVS